MKKWLMLMVGILAISLTGCASGDEQQKEGGPKKVVLSVHTASDYYKSAKAEFEALHPNTVIEIKEYKSEGGNAEADFEKYVQTTNTQILSGKGADLIDLNVAGLQVGKYVNKNALVNLTELMEQDKSFNKDHYYMNIFEHAKMNGGLYVLPTRFFLDTLIGDSEAITAAQLQIDDKQWTWSQFAQAGKQLHEKSGRYAIANTPPAQMLSYLVTDNYSQLVDSSTSNAKFQSPFFIDMLGQVKAMYDNKVITADPLGVGEAYFYPLLLLSPSDYFTETVGFFKQGKVYRKPHTSEQLSGVSFKGANPIAINANSKVKPEAWKFLTFLLSDQFQSKPNQQGFAVNKSANEKVMKQLLEKGKVGSHTGVDVPVTAADMEMLKQMIAEANIFVKEDDKIHSIINEEATAYFSGQKSAEDVANLIQNRVTTYLNE
ncbi:extracellular solute-binding protein [Paenibacillus sp. SC116]|uniref:ABC transporter substrate-binding protein n=1 Tax=Paenibacillus sp. SC116 TaxID=2968986 RepID=UPI00215A5391|nr:extracellular solute-binding protein [Paenibacillus sp. SC116]MCR8844518.1 extracellular solute-binding protein [Paenibacillus sp. SC116]